MMIDREFIEFQQALAGEYSLERELGRGGMGIVYLAREVQLNRLVAIKLLPPALAARQDVRDRFLREARMAASLSHPHIVPIYRVGEARGFVFFVMAYVEGETLGERLRTRGPLSTAAAARMLREVTWALSYAHGRGIVHRDIKPDNILLEAETGRALVSDFGIALGPEETVITDPGRVMGSAHFMSPEQASSEPLDGRSDLYSLGVVAYLAVSGRLPFDAPSVPALMAKHVGSEVPRLADVAQSVPRALAGVIERCLQKSPADRYTNGEALAEALDGASSPVRAKLPLALRVWTQARDPLVPFYIYLSSVSTLVLLRQLVHPREMVDGWLLGGIALLPAALATVFNARKAFKALSAGYTVRDLQAALAIWQQERREELSFEIDEAEPRWARVLRGVTWTAVGTAAVAAVALDRFNIMQLSISAAVFATAGIGIAASISLGVRLVGKQLRLRSIGAVRSLIWNSRAGVWAAKLLTPRNRKMVSDVDYRPTEMALGLAVDELFAALPSTYREQLSDLPTVVAGLEARAAEARARVDELSALAAIGGSSISAAPDDVAAALDAAKHDLAETVAALESVRLDLLRLHGGAGDLRPITSVLDAARDLGNELSRLYDAQREVNTGRRRSALDITPATPA